MLKQFYQTDPWLLGEDIPNADLFFSNVWLKTFVTTSGLNTGRGYERILCRYEGYHLWFYFGEHDGYEVGEHIAKKIIEEPGYAQTVNQNIIRVADELRAFSETIPQQNLSSLSNSEIWNIYPTHQKIHSEYYTWCWIPVAADMFHNNITKRFKNYLRTKAVSESDINTTLVKLTQPTEKSLIFIEQEELLKIAIELSENNETRTMIETSTETEIFNQLPIEFQNKLEAHRAKYYYTKHIWVSGEYTIADYVNQIKEIFATGIEPSDILKKQYQELERSKQEKEKTILLLDIRGQWKDVCKAFGDFMITKIYRRYAQLLAVHHMSAILKEIARRMFLTEKQVRFALPVEMKQILLEDKNMSDELQRRTKRCVWYADANIDTVWTGAEADQIFSELEKSEVVEGISELRGEVGCVGYAKGKVKIIIRAEDMAKMNQGDILVSIATDPDIVPAMKKAGAIVTEQGGITSHAAIVSRELGIPCLIGTKIATRIFKDGDMVEVDATKGIVRLIT
ncbi:MAG: hypothetical protein A2821_03350 [Candidatus Magasanikbacteria bacterium RIFCSPHIGHO2_01_FULL_41_23]|uniref:PEP-utilising enzyme mobile domain-containing protein n=1 Tax=Candidatus Magasanikbacteria bacterium RIFCSPLOWO2_01_FULL_40_15 TaxID=1798686 RepID=A0A1F6N3R3_9BACT|nr:MAG: hypothetical protein A2821_03350 [Candidatus Magasanikbacteria bacterium RIFCSPHIGHO2_01_FULL_41_23]OGH76696.1 MAG: hypothetical protein A3F22_03835 [Candidatus Magasanikbacteria bacterium RIFCSPHIGHO2_12_FULL_41_16]OGH78636.1 MAG: hypothetical protein A2983_04735 [Candidatus Magasanikbacteria bacterium RIFCSPLOWO2_01_FULL_40_15]